MIISQTIEVSTEELRNMGMSLEDAKKLMSPKTLDRLHKVVTERPTINVERKANCDILMQALCRAVQDEVIQPESLNDKVVKLLNAKTSTLSPPKLGDILSSIRKHQPNIGCMIEVREPIHDDVIRRWVFTGPEVNFDQMFGEIIRLFNITPSLVRSKMTETLKPTIVNNIAQVVAKYLNNEDDLNVSITTVTRLVGMCGYLIYAEFKEVD